MLSRCWQAVRRPQVKLIKFLPLPLFRSRSGSPPATGLRVSGCGSFERFAAEGSGFIFVCIIFIIQIFFGRFACLVCLSSLTGIFCRSHVEISSFESHPINSQSRRLSICLGVNLPVKFRLFVLAGFFGILNIPSILPGWSRIRRRFKVKRQLA